MTFYGKAGIVTLHGGRRVAAPPMDLLRGTLDLLVLRALSWGPAHGYGVARWIERATGEALRI